MTLNTLKYMLVVLFLIGIVGALSWFLYQWMILNDPIPDGALKVLGCLWKRS